MKNEEKVYETGYKAFNPDMTCNGKQYEENTVYEESGADSCCHAGVMHYCQNPFDALKYYPLVNERGKVSEFAKVEALAEPLHDGNKSATRKLKIGAKLGLTGFVNACVDFLYEETIKDMPVSRAGSGDAAQIGSSGRYAQIGSSGNAAQIGSSGYAAQIGSSGNAAQIGSSGYAAKIGSSGRYAQIGSSGYAAQINCQSDHAVAAAIGINGMIKGPVGTWITLAEYGKHDGEGYPCVCVRSAQIDGDNLKPDTWYKLENGEFVEVDEK